MAEIHVVFPKDSKSPTIVYSDPKAVLGGRFINWHIHSYNPKVKEVEIQFDKGENRYFPVRTDSGYNTRRSWYRKAVRDVGGGAGECTIWGQAPRHNRKQKHKYTVLGLDGKGEHAVPPLDPEIINDPPRKKPKGG